MSRQDDELDYFVSARISRIEHAHMSNHVTSAAASQPASHTGGVTFVRPLPENSESIEVRIIPLRGEIVVTLDYITILSNHFGRIPLERSAQTFNASIIPIGSGRIVLLFSVVLVVFAQTFAVENFNFKFGASISHQRKCGAADSNHTGGGRESARQHCDKSQSHFAVRLFAGTFAAAACGL